MSATVEQEAACCYSSSVLSLRSRGTICFGVEHFSVVPLALRIFCFGAKMANEDVERKDAHEANKGDR